MLAFSLLMLAVVANGFEVHECSIGKTKRCCGDGVCDAHEDINTCLADCPGVTTNEECGEERMSSVV